MLNFLKREKLYILMLFFIVSLNVLYSSHTDDNKDQTHTVREEKSFSSMTFKEIGVTEERVKEFFESGGIKAAFFKNFIIIAFFVFISAILLNIFFILRGKRNKLGLFSGIPISSWGVLDIVRASIVIVFISYLIGIAEVVIFKRFGIDIAMNLRMMLNTFLIDTAVITTVLYFVCVKYKSKISALGLSPKGFFRNIFLGVSIYILALPSLLVILLLSVWLMNVLGYEPPPQPVFEVFMEEKRSRILLFLTLFVSVFGPIAEEIFFRGFMYPSLKKHVGVLKGALIAGIVFSALHTNIVGFLPILALGMLLAYLYEKTGSLVSSIAVHMAHNSAILIFVFFIKEMMR